jgi:autotransporter translocation and assembly factor TamB
MRAGNGLVRIEGAQGTWQGSALRGNLAYFPKDRKILGVVGGPAVQLASVSKAINISGLSGTAAGQALFSGTIDDPIAAIRASGTVAYRAPKAGKPLSGTFIGAGNYSARGLDVTSLSIDTKTGTVAATGHADPKGALALNVAARGVSLHAFAPEISGLASFSGTVGGTASNPQIDGKAQVVEMVIADQEIPLVIANVTANKDRIRATSIDAARGAAQASGDLAYIFNTGGINGSLTAANLPLSELSERMEGFLDITKATIGGTINSPIVDADVATHAMVVADRSIGRGQATVALRGNDFTASKVNARFAGGTVTASASGNIKTKETRVELEGKDLSLPDLVPEASQSATLDGKVNGSGVVTLLGTELRYARGSGQLSDVKVNQTMVGNGPWNANVDPNAFAGAFQVGLLDRYLDVSSISLNRKTNQFDAKLAAYLIPLQDIYSAAHRYIPDPTNDLERRLLRIQGTADAEATISGVLGDPDLRVNILNLTGLSLEGKDLGEMKFAFDKSGRVWTVAEASWNGVAGTLRSSGRADLDKDIVFEGDFTNVDLGLLSIIDDSLTRIGGRGAISFAVSGPTRSPLIQASLDASRTTVLTGQDNAPALEFGMVLDTINISQSVLAIDGKLAGGIEASGKLFYRGLEGNIAAHVPLEYPLTLPQGQPLMVSLDFPQRELQTLGEYLPGLDITRTEGTIRGNITMSGAIGHAQINGHLTAEAKTLAMNKVQSTLGNAVATVSANAESLKVHFEGLGSEGGSVLFDAYSPIGDVSDRIKELTSRGLDSLLDRPINGDLAITDFGVRYNGGAENGRLIARANAKISASGPLRQPAVTGNANISNVATMLPSFEMSSAAPVNFVIDPTFNVTLGMDNVAEVSTSLAKLRVIGGGTLNGSLNKPSVSSDLTVMGGTVTLPTTSVRIDPGGTVRLRYQTGPGGDTLASLDVDLAGRTSLTTLDAGDVPQRYEITLQIRGDLLQEGQTLVTAESDPPGLGQDRIVALLGQADLIQALAGSVTNLQASKELRNVLAGVALPALLSPLTGAFAKGLGLDYLDISYDPLNQVSVSFAKDLGKNFSFQGTRQVSQPLPGIETQFDLRLVYRLPFKGKEFRRTTVSFGVDQDRPWKVGLQYSIRF